MKYECYMTDGVRVSGISWMHFVSQDFKDQVNLFYKAIERKEKDKLAFHPSGEAFYINEDGYKYKGEWFDIEDRRIAVFYQLIGFVK